MKHLLFYLLVLVNKFSERLTWTHFNSGLCIKDSQFNTLLGIVLIKIKELVLSEWVLGGLHQVSILNCWMSSDELTDV